MTRIKICGITNAKDARAAIDYGADALGFIAVPGSPRYIDPADYLELWEQQNFWPGTFISTVIVAQRPEQAVDYAPQYVQFYEGGFGALSPGRAIRAFRVRDEGSLQEIAAYQEPAAAHHLDTYHKDKLGGSGETFNWELAIEAKRLTDKPIILAGGLTPENVAEAVARVRPYAVDVSSGVEAEPGRKDYDKLRRFIRAVREVDALFDD